MTQLTVEQLIEQGILILEEPDVDTMSSDGFTSYVINPDYVILTNSECTDQSDMVTYVQLVAQAEGEPPFWVLQLLKHQEDPNFIPLNTPSEIELFKKV